MRPAYIALPYIPAVSIVRIPFFTEATEIALVEIAVHQIHQNTSLLVVDKGAAAFLPVAALRFPLGIAIILADAEVAVDDPGTADVALGKRCSSHITLIWSRTKIRLPSCSEARNRK